MMHGVMFLSFGQSFQIHASNLLRSRFFAWCCCFEMCFINIVLSQKIKSKYLRYYGNEF